MKDKDHHPHSSIDGTDFMGIVQRTLTFPPGGDDVIQVSIPIINDTIDEPAETFFATLFTSQPNVEIIEDAATVEIIDDDGECADAFESSDDEVGRECVYCGVKISQMRSYRNEMKSTEVQTSPMLASGAQLLPCNIYMLQPDC